ncbi:MAG: glycosyltransferase 87 family protein [Acidimicrobiales bacterium]
MRSAVLSAYRRFMSWAPIDKDVFFYLCATVFAVTTAAVAISADYREWGEMAAVAYGIGTAVSAVAAVAARWGTIGPAAASFLRRFVVVAVLLGAVVVPLVCELIWRAEARPGPNAQSEVAVVERAGDRLAEGRSPYLDHPVTVGVSPRSDAKSIDANSFYPYLPGMAPFGLANAAAGPAELGDARLTLAGFTLVVSALALLGADATVARRGRVLQFLVVLPTGALAMVTGGDDLPVLALMLAGLVLAARRRPFLAGLVLGWAATLKFTAWPVIALAVLAVRDRDDRPAPRRYAAAVALVAVPVIGVGFATNPGAFFENVIRFPLGLTAVKSPAASPLFGQMLVTMFPDHRRLVTAALIVVGLGVVVYALRRWTPRTVAEVARFTAWAMLLATLLAPATRFGYLMYPANLFVWAYLLDGMVPATRTAGAEEGAPAPAPAVLAGGVAPAAPG